MLVSVERRPILSSLSLRELATVVFGLVRLTVSITLVHLVRYGAPGGIETMNIVGAKFIVHSSCLASKEEW